MGITAIYTVIILAHTGLIPNFGFGIPTLFFVGLYLKYYGERFSDLVFEFKSISRQSILL